MRELQVMGMTEDGKAVVLDDPQNNDRFWVTADDKLRSATRGDLAKIAPAETVTGNQLRPRDIQNRIRAGASVADVVAETGMPEHKVDQFAYPILLERSHAANLAQQAHAVRDSGPTVQTLAEIVALAFSERGHDLSTANWDAWKNDRNQWVAQLQWTVGHSTINAEWRYQPDGHGGTVVPLNEGATDLIDPDFGRPLRGLSAAKRGLFEPTTAPEPVAAPEEVQVELELDLARASGDSAPAPARRSRPAMPSWDEVLLGVRSH